MNLYYKIFLICILGILSCSWPLISFAASTNFNSENNVYVSPNQKLRVELEGTENDLRLNVYNNVSKKLEGTIGIPTKLLFLKWAQNSDYFIIIQHIAGGTYATLVHMYEGKWIGVDLIPPGNDPNSFTVITLETVKQIFLAYKITRQADNGHVLGFELCSFTVDPVTGIITDVQKKEISDREYENIKSLK